MSRSIFVLRNKIASEWFHLNLQFIQQILSFAVGERIRRSNVNLHSFSTSIVVHNPNIGKLLRCARTDAQAALFDYLHYTRSLEYDVADHISRNSPNFLQNLLSKIDPDGEDITASLRKFLRYNPINEFEPFFESMGLNSSEISLLAPGHLIYLRDQSFLLDNVRVLFGYGIPKAKIGKIYMEAKAVFELDSVVLNTKIQEFEDLGFGRMAVIRAISSYPSLLMGRVDEFSRVLEKLKRFGIFKGRVGGYLCNRGSCNWKEMNKSLDFMEKLGYCEEQVSSSMKEDPLLMAEGLSKKVYILFVMFVKLGLDPSEICLLFINNPQVLSYEASKNVLQAIDVLLNMDLGVKRVARIIATHFELLCSSSLRGSKSIYKRFNIKRDAQYQLISENPLEFFNLASRTPAKGNRSISTPQIPARKLKKIEFLLRLGYVENSEEMVRALRLFRGNGDQLQERFDCIVQAGLDPNLLSSLIKRVPMVINQQKHVIMGKLDFLFNTLAYPIESLAEFPSYLCYNVEMVGHRFSMYQWLREQGLKKPMMALSTILACSVSRFMKYFVHVHPQGMAKWESIIRKDPAPR